MGRASAPRKTRSHRQIAAFGADFTGFSCRNLPAPALLSYILGERQEPIRTDMNAPTELNHDEMLGIRLEVLRREHRDLDQAIHALEETGRPDQLTLRRLKKQKLSLKDQIVKIEDMLIPDIIA
jgi:hypothetical protein